jgi:hypothetical protein
VHTSPNTRCAKIGLKKEIKWFSYLRRNILLILLIYLALLEDPKKNGGNTSNQM